MKTAVLLLCFAILGVSQAHAQGAQDAPISDDGLTPLMRASGTGQLEEVRSLLKAGADVNAKLDSLGLTALMMAAGAGHLEVVKVLLEAGADPNAAGGVAHVGFFTPLSMAMNPRNKNRLDLIDTLLASGAQLNPPRWFPESALFAAVIHHDLEMIQALLNRGSDVNWENSIGSTALVRAVAMADANIEVVRLLLNAGANPNKPRLWVGDECVSILKFLDPWPRMPRDKVKEEIRRLIIQAGGKRFVTKYRGKPC